jgi:hypothetical protein
MLQVLSIKFAGVRKVVLCLRNVQKFHNVHLVSKPKKKHKPNNDMLHHLQHILYVQGGQACRQA